MSDCGAETSSRRVGSPATLHRKGKPISKPTFNREFAEARKKAGLRGLIFHDFRRTAARNMIRGGVPQSVAMRVTGHRSDSMFRRYDVASLDDKLEALRRARSTRQRARQWAGTSPRSRKICQRYSHTWTKTRKFPKEFGWEAGTRTPIHWSRASCPTIERPPSRSRERGLSGMRGRRSNWPGGRR